MEAAEEIRLRILQREQPLSEVASELDVDTREALIGVFGLYVEPDLETLKRMLKVHGPGTLFPAYVRYTAALALAAGETLDVLEAPDDARKVLERDSWIVQKSWVFTNGLGDPTPAELIRILRGTIHVRKVKTASSAGALNPLIDAVVPHGFPYSTRFRYGMVDVIVGTRSLQPAPVIRLDELMILIHRLADRPPGFYTAVRVCPIRTLGLPEQVGAVLPGLLVLAQILTGHLPTGINWYVKPEWHPDASHIMMTHKRFKGHFKIRGSFHVGFPTERTVNAQSGRFGDVHWTQLITYLGDRERNPLPKPPAPGFPHALLRAYVEVTGADVFDTDQWERESEHPHGPAASLTTVPDLELKPGEVRKLAEGLLRLRDALSGLGSSSASITDAALELLNLAYGIRP